MPRARTPGPRVARPGGPGPSRVREIAMTRPRRAGRRGRSRPDADRGARRRVRPRARGQARRRPASRASVEPDAPLGRALRAPLAVRRGVVGGAGLDADALSRLRPGAVARPRRKPLEEGPVGGPSAQRPQERRRAGRRSRRATGPPPRPRARRRRARSRPRGGRPAAARPAAPPSGRGGSRPRGEGRRLRQGRRPAGTASQGDDPDDDRHGDGDRPQAPPERARCASAGRRGTVRLEPLDRGGHAVTPAALAGHVARLLGAVAERPAQHHDAVGQRLVGDVLVRPHRLEQVLPPHHVGVASDEDDEQVEGARGQDEPLPAPAHRRTRHIDDEIAHPVGFARAPHGPDSSLKMACQPLGVPLGCDWIRLGSPRPRPYSRTTARSQGARASASPVLTARPETSSVPGPPTWGADWGFAEKFR